MTDLGGTAPLNGCVDLEAPTSMKRKESLQQELREKARYMIGRDYGRTLEYSANHFRHNLLYILAYRTEFS